MDDRIRKRLIKVLELAQKGVGGERVNAQKILDEQLAKWGMTLADLGLEPDLVANYSYARNISERRLIMQIAAAVTNDRNIRQIGKSERNIRIDATVMQHIEIEAMVRYYGKLWRTEVYGLYIAFINKHDLFTEEGRKLSAKNEGTDGADNSDRREIHDAMLNLRKSNYTPARRTLNSA